MIKFFRKIRQKLLAENKFSKYLLYAIGEIILVVIGILIALQIGQWNKESEINKLELTILKEIESNLNDDLNQMQGDISLMQVMDTACVNLKNAINTNSELTKDFSDNASLLRVMPHYQPNKSGYDLLVSKGISIISNDSLRNSISTHYENLYTYYNRYEEERFMFHINISEPKLLEYFSFEFDLDNTYYWIANISLKDYEKLLDDESFTKVLKAIESENKQVLSRAIRVANSIEKQLYFLNNEIQDIE
ncbi:DUF6090 family protein [Marinirhabdus gelatinilytica]|uniref:Uncharacterized protein n=1 Tax=Marinirhabdus gelatinilytica TaxID=1703343 RepID=A0A370Q597_9FLAO|nr:DUF6090 family protein [Marinirhabdus gelatinilytica]RDK83528.1 hypothetical protein C8D94_10765 [Marinirhabdus gelatinilytica]